MSKTAWTALSFLFLSVSAFATDLTLSVASGGQNSIAVPPQAVVNYQVVAELSDNLNEGLAMFVFDLSMTGVTLPSADAPTSANMLNFATPLGLNNPSGFGGTFSGGKLRQVGGAQNTINNFFAPIPSGTVITQIAQNGTPEVLVSGSFTAPSKVGAYTLDVSNVLANVIRLGETGFPFWAVDAAGNGGSTSLTVNVVALTADVATLSISSPGTQTLSLNAGPANANRMYWVLGSLSGTSPGLPCCFFNVLPLNYDVYMEITIVAPNSALLSNSLAFLDGTGQSNTFFNLPSGLSGSLAGVEVNHAFVVINPPNWISNAQAVTLVP